jgi:release factor glutamine methyltransferase
MTVAEALADAARRLSAAGVEDAPRDARRLMAHALGVEPGRVTLMLRDLLAEGAALSFDTLVARRLRREPVAQIVGLRAFWGRDFVVTSAVLDPRPETELLVETALSRPFSAVLDLGTGSGAILLTLLAERPDATGLGVDLSPAALDIARLNARRLGLSGRAGLREGSWYGPVTGRFDLIVANPPYIASAEMPGLAAEVRDWEPAMALTDGGDGLGAYRAITLGAAGHLAEGGRLILEIGWRQGPAVAALCREAGLADVRILRDLAGHDRVVTANLR